MKYLDVKHYARVIHWWVLFVMYILSKFPNLLAI